MEEASFIFLLENVGVAFSAEMPKKKKISACAHFQLKQTAGLVYNISLIILMAWILDNGEQGEKIVS